MEEAINQANQANQATEWILITFFIIAPVLIVLISIPVVAIHQRRLKCPRCGFWRKNRITGVQSVKTVDGNKATVNTQSLVVCRKCKHEFSV